MVLNLASKCNSPDRSTKSTRSYINVLPQLVNTGFQVLFHSPPGVLFTFPSQYYTLSVTEEYLALRGGPRSFTQSSTCFVLLWILPLPSESVYGAFTLSDQLSQNCSTFLRVTYAVLTPERTRSGLGSFPFARRYSENRFFFLFLRLLRCFSSPGSLPYVMYWRMDDWSFSSRVSPFRNPRINGYLLLPAAYRSLSRLSSALSAKASALCSFLLDLAMSTLRWSFQRLHAMHANYLVRFFRT